MAPAPGNGALDTEGYLVIDGLLDAALLAGVRAAVDAALERDGVRGPTGTLHVDNLEGPAVDALWHALRLVAAVEHVLGAGFGRHAMGLRAPNPCQDLAARSLL
ncbi:MAG: hypothetical protein ACRD0H_06170 [Actinomycetes bacterium]